MTTNRAGLGVISGEIADQLVVQGCGFDSGNGEARVPMPRTLTLLDIPESATRIGLPPRPPPIGRISSEARTRTFLYRYRIAFSACRPHKPSTHLKTKISEIDSKIDKEPGCVAGGTWSHQWRDSRSGCISGLWFRQRESPYHETSLFSTNLSRRLISGCPPVQHSPGTH